MRELESVSGTNWVKLVKECLLMLLNLKLAILSDDIVGAVEWGDRPWEEHIKGLIDKFEELKLKTDAKTENFSDKIGAVKNEVDISIGNIHNRLDTIDGRITKLNSLIDKLEKAEKKK